MESDAETAELARRMIAQYGGQAHNFAVKWIREARSVRDERTAEKWQLVLLAINAMRKMPKQDAG